MVIILKLRTPSKLHDNKYKWHNFTAMMKFQLCLYTNNGTYEYYYIQPQQQLCRQPLINSIQSLTPYLGIE